MRDRPQTLFCNMYEWQTGTKITSMDKGSKLTYLGESTTYDTGQMGLVSESRETKKVYKMIFDEDSTVRRKLSRTFNLYEKKKNSNDCPLFWEN